MLQMAKILEDERAYVLTKLFATTGIAVLDLPAVTVEAGPDRSHRSEIGQEAGNRPFSGQPASGPAALRPGERPSLRHDFHQEGRLSHRQNPGQPVHPKAGAGGEGAAEKGNIRALRQLYKTTISGIEANFDLLVRQAYERQLETEQLSVGWE